MSCSSELKKLQITTDQGIFTAQVLGLHGDWVVCWPSRLSDSEALSEFAHLLAQDHRVVLCDPPAIGLNANLPYTTSIHELVHYGVHVLKRAGIEQCHWVGLGAGGVMGAALYSAMPGSIRSLTLASAPLLSQDRLKMHQTVSTTLLAGSSLGRRLLASRAVNAIGFASEQERLLLTTYINKVLERTSAKTLAALRPLDGASVRRVFERLRQEPPPILVISGEHDRVVLLRDQRTVAEVMRGQFVSLPCGGLSLLVEPKACAQAFRRFVSQLDQRPSAPQGLAA